MGILYLRNGIKKKKKKCWHRYDLRWCVGNFLPFVADGFKPVLHALLQLSQRCDPKKLLDLA